MKPLGTRKLGRIALLSGLIGAAAIFVPSTFAMEDAFVQIERQEAGGANMAVLATGVGYESAEHSGAQARDEGGHASLLQSAEARDRRQGRLRPCRVIRDEG